MTTTIRSLVIAGATLCVIAVLVVAGFAASYYHTQKEKAALDLTTAQERNAMFAPKVSTDGIDCALAPEDKAKSSRQYYISLQAPAPEKVSAKVTALIQKYGGVVGTDSNSYNNTYMGHSEGGSVSLTTTVSVDQADALTADLDALVKADPSIFVESKNQNATQAENLYNACISNLNQIQTLQLKEAVYLDELKNGISDDRLEIVTQGLEQVRNQYTSYTSTYNASSLHLNQALNAASFSISISKANG